MTALSEINGVSYFKELPFYNKPIKKPEIKRLTDINLLAELAFYEQPNIIKTNQAFKGYAISYKVDIVEKKDPGLQLGLMKDLAGLLNRLNCSMLIFQLIGH